MTLFYSGFWIAQLLGIGIAAVVAARLHATAFRPITIRPMRATFVVVYISMLFTASLLHLFTTLTAAQYAGLAVAVFMVGNIVWCVGPVRHRLVALPFLAAPLLYGLYLLVCFLAVLAIGLPLGMWNNIGFGMWFVVIYCQSVYGVLLVFCLGTMVSTYHVARTQPQPYRTGLWLGSALLVGILIWLAVGPYVHARHIVTDPEISEQTRTVVHTLHTAPLDDHVLAYVTDQVPLDVVRASIAALETLIIPPRAIPSGAISEPHGIVSRVGGEELGSEWRARALLLINAIDPPRGLELSIRVLDPRILTIEPLPRQAVAIVDAGNRTEAVAQRIIQTVEGVHKPHLTRVDANRQYIEDAITWRAANILMLLNTDASTQWLEQFVHEQLIGTDAYGNKAGEVLRVLVQRNKAVYMPLAQEFFGNSSHPGKRRAALRALGATQDPKALRRLLHELERTPRLPIADRNGIVKAIGALGSPEAMTVLLDIAAGTYGQHVRVTAIEALGNIGDQRATQPLLDIFDVPEAQTKKRSGSYRFVRDTFAIGAVAKALGQIGDPRATSFLTRLLQRSVDADMQGAIVSGPGDTAAIAVALEDLGDPNALPALEEAHGRLNALSESEKQRRWLHRKIRAIERAMEASRPLP